MREKSDCFLLRPNGEPKHRFAYIGVPHDAATSLGNPGARLAPGAIRERLSGIFNWRLQNNRLADIERGVIDFSFVEIKDFGDVELSYHDPAAAVEETYQVVLSSLRSGYTPVIVGGDHGITYPCVKAFHDARSGNIGLIQLDAHCDLMDFSGRQGRYSGSSGIRRSLELDRLSGRNIAQIGLRGFTTVEQYEIGSREGIRRISAIEFNKIGAAASAERALNWLKGGTESIYLTVDIDVVNPGEAPGSGWAEPGGLTGQEMIDFVRTAAPHIDAIDVAEVNPLFDSSNHATSILAARLIMEFITGKIQV